ncbi:MAG: hypothetical protein HC824_09280 [Synechococcales cyanobacterium RM1_1_8]|nr:hypothetical protein [Synechococcales cyanobacterium RM1_1_8]
MNPAHLRHFWSLVEACHAPKLLQLDDQALYRWLLGQLAENPQLEGIEVDSMGQYIQARLPLVRDLAQARLIGS